MKHITVFLLLLCTLLATPSHSWGANVSAATLSSISSSTSSQAVVAANPGRKGLILVNDSTANAYVAFAATATTSVYTLKMEAASTWILQAPVHTGAISVIWDAANGSLKVTEQN